MRHIYTYRELQVIIAEEPVLTVQFFEELGFSVYQEYHQRHNGQKSPFGLDNSEKRLLYTEAELIAEGIKPIDKRSLRYKKEAA